MSMVIWTFKCGSCHQIKLSKNGREQSDLIIFRSDEPLGFAIAEMSYISKRKNVVTINISLQTTKLFIFLPFYFTCNLGKFS